MHSRRSGQSSTVIRTGAKLSRSSRPAIYHGTGKRNNHASACSVIYFARPDSEIMEANGI